MTARKLSKYLIAGIVLFMLALMPGISHGQLSDSISVRYGEVNGGTINVDLDQRVDIPVYIQTGLYNYVADIHLVLGANLQYIDSLLSDTEGDILYPFNEWDFAAFSERFDDTQPEGWASQAFIGWARITPDSENPWLYTTVPTHCLTFVFKTNDDVNNIGDDAIAIGPGNSPYGGPSSAGDTLGGYGFEVVELFSTFHFDGGGYIEGIVSTVGGDPIENVCVLNIETDKEAYTDNEGFYHMGLYPGTHDMIFTHDDFLPEHISDVVVEIDMTTTVNDTMHQTGGIMGTVTRWGSGNPLEDVLVSILNGDYDTTDEFGNYALTDLQPGTYDVYFSHPDHYDSVVTDVEVFLDDYTVLDMELDIIVGINDISLAMPTVFSIGQNYPNPFNAKTSIEYSIPENAAVTIDVYDLHGRHVTTLVNGFQTAGYHTVSWNAGNMTSGIYFYKIQVNDYIEQKSMLLLK
ncbi:MAG: T9SS type A sorting domain-containing protein [candidate division Zixibacteria bacterium]|nr:T9SS type A sorting domain-containing protein [candidate division Zixibacteria bacterium]